LALKHRRPLGLGEGSVILPAKGSHGHTQLRRQAVRFLLVGGVNTIAGLSLIYGLIFVGLGPIVANVIGYSLLLPLGYLAHSFVSFNYRGPHIRSSLRYLLALVVSYLASMGVLVVASKVLGFNDYLAQLPAFATYAIVFFLLSRIFVFSVPGPATPERVRAEAVPGIGAKLKS
jgi:putative flippase GtrA